MVRSSWLLGLSALVACQTSAAYRARNAGTLSEEILNLSEHLRDKPNDGYAHLALADAYRRSGRPADSTRSLVRALDLQTPIESHRDEFARQLDERARQRMQLGVPGALADVKRAQRLGRQSRELLRRARFDQIKWLLRRGSPRDLSSASELLRVVGRPRWAQSLGQLEPLDNTFLQWMWQRGARKTTWRVATTDGTWDGPAHSAVARANLWWHGIGHKLPTAFQQLPASVIHPCLVTNHETNCRVALQRHAPQGATLPMVQARATALGWKLSLPALPGLAGLSEAKPTCAQCRTHEVARVRALGRRFEVPLAWPKPLPKRWRAWVGKVSLARNRALIAMQVLGWRGEFASARRIVADAHAESPDDPLLSLHYALFVAKQRPDYAEVLLMNGAAFSGDGGRYLSAACPRIRISGASLLAVRIGKLALSLSPPGQRQAAAACVVRALRHLGRDANAAEVERFYGITAAPPPEASVAWMLGESAVLLREAGPELRVMPQWRKLLQSDFPWALQRAD